MPFLCVIFKILILGIVGVNHIRPIGFFWALFKMYLNLTMPNFDIIQSPVAQGINRLVPQGQPSESRLG